MHRFIVYSVRFQSRLTWNPLYLSSGLTYNTSMTLYYCSDEHFNYILRRRPLFKIARSYKIHINEDEFRRSSYLRELMKIGIKKTVIHLNSLKCIVHIDATSYCLEQLSQPSYSLSMLSHVLRDFTLNGWFRTLKMWYLCKVMHQAKWIKGTQQPRRPNGDYGQIMSLTAISPPRS